MIVKELLAKFGIEYDAASFKQADSLINGITSSAGKMVAAFAGIQGLKLGFEMAREAAQFEDSRRIFEATGTSLEDLRKLSKGVLSDVDLVTNFNMAEGFGVSVGEFANFIEIADAAAKKFGKSQKFMLESLTKGVAKKSAPWLDNLGIILDQERIQKDLAGRLGKNVGDLTDKEIRAELTKNAIAQGNAIVASVKKAGAGAGSGASDFYDQWDSALSNTRIAFGRVFDQVIQQVLQPIVTWVQNNRDKIDKFAKTLEKNVPRAIKVVSVALTLLAVRSIGNLIISFVNLTIGIAANTFALVLNAAAVFDAAVWQAYLAGGVSQSAVAFGVATKMVRNFILSLLSGPIVIGLLLAAIILLGEEIAAMFDDDKLGLFEHMSGRWRELRDELINGITTEDFSLMTVFRAAGVLITGMFDLADRFFAILAEGSYATADAVEWLVTKLFDANVQLAELLSKLPGAAFDLATSPFTAAAAYLTDSGSVSPSPASGTGTQNAVESNLTVNVDATGSNPADKGLASTIADKVKTVHLDALRAAMSALTPSKDTP